MWQCHGIDRSVSSEALLFRELELDQRLLSVPPCRGFLFSDVKAISRWRRTLKKTNSENYASSASLLSLVAEIPQCMKDRNIRVGLLEEGLLGPSPPPNS